MATRVVELQAGEVHLTVRARRREEYLRRKREETWRILRDNVLEDPQSGIDLLARVCRTCGAPIVSYLIGGREVMECEAGHRAADYMEGRGFKLAWLRAALVARGRR